MLEFTVDKEKILVVSFLVKYRFPKVIYNRDAEPFLTRGPHSLLGNFLGAISQGWVRPEAKVGRTVTVNVTFAQARFCTHSHIPFYPPCRQRKGAIRIQGNIPARQNILGGCEETAGEKCELRRGGVGEIPKG